MEPRELKNKMKEFCDGDDKLYKNCVALFEFGVIHIGSIGRQNKLKTKIDEMFPDEEVEPPVDEETKTPVDEETKTPVDEETKTPVDEETKTSAEDD